MTVDPACLLDTNILLRLRQRSDPHYFVTSNAVLALHRKGTRLCYTSQILAEFWNVSTRPTEKNGLGLSIVETNGLLNEYEQQFHFLEDSAAVHHRWRELVFTYTVKGAKVHDARLVAAMLVHQVPRILTFNTADFTRYPDILPLHPGSLVHPL